MSGEQDDLFNMWAKPRKMSIWNIKSHSCIDEVYRGCTEREAEWRTSYQAGSTTCLPTCQAQEFRCRSIPRSDSHSEVLANMEPWRLNTDSRVLG